MRGSMDIFDRAVGHQQSISVIEILPVAGCAVDGLLRARTIVRMNALKDHIEREKRGLVVAKYSESFVRPDDFAGDGAPAETAGVAQSLCFGQICFALPEGIFSLLALSNVLACDQDNQLVIQPPHGFGVFTNPKR